MKKNNSQKKAAIKAAIVNQLKSLAVPVILCAVIGVLIYVVITFKDETVEEEASKIKRYEGTEEPMIMENDDLLFTLDPLTTQFTLEVKDTGKIWYSNPTDAATNPLIISESEREKMQSTLLMTYSLKTGLTNTYDNYKYSINKGIYDIEQGSDAKGEYIRINYSIGNVQREYYIPPVTTADKFEEYISKMEPKYAQYVKDYYTKYDINNLRKKDEANKEQLLADYPIMAEQVIYVLNPNTQQNLKVTFEEVFASIGYTMDDYKADCELSNASATTNTPVFGISMIYRLDGDEFVVEVPYDAMIFSEDNPIYKITPLPYFGAGGTEDEGFLMVPEGGGAIINFNNGKTNQESYYSNMYGWDMALVRDELVVNTRSYFNAFGIANGKDSFLCILEEGAPYGSVVADIAGKSNNRAYNYANVEYSVVCREQYDVGAIANSAVFVFQKELPAETLTQRYRFIASDSYVDMAKNYQSYLLDKYGSDLTMNTDTSAPVNFEIVGAVDKVRQVVGVPVSRPWKLTTYEEAEEMIRELATTDGIKNMSVKLTGWCNGGVQQQMLSKVKTIGALGGKKDLKNLSAAAKELGVDLYLDGITQYAHDSNLLDGFFSYTDAAKNISKERMELYVYSDVTYIAREGLDPYYLLHTDVANEMVNNLVEATKKYETGVSFKDLGMDLSSDFYRKNYRSRYSVMVEQQAKLKELSDSGMNIMTNVGSDYAVAYSDMITNMNLRGNKYTLIDEFIPFYQMAIHGMVNYTGYSINTCGHEVDEILYAAEYGAGLQFSFMKESTFALQKTLYTEYYGSEYAVWHDRMLEIYNRYNSELGHTFNQKMVDHDNITKNLSCTVYEDGTKVYVNYSYDDYQTEDGVVPARDYMVVK